MVKSKDKRNKRPVGGFVEREKWFTEVGKRENRLSDELLPCLFVRTENLPSNTLATHRWHSNT